VRILSTTVMAVAAIGAAGAIAAGSVPAMAATTSGVRYRELAVSAGWLGPGLSGDEDECSMLLLSAADSAGSPAYVSGLLQSSTSDPCTGWLEDSVDGGAWTDVSPQQTLPGTAQGLVNYPWAKTDDYYAGPGTSVRACVLTPATPGFPSETECSSTSVTLPASDAAAPADDGTSVLYAHNDQSVNVSGDGAACRVFLSSSGSLDKTAASQASMTVTGTTTCTAWLETSANNGTTWAQATPTYSLPFTNPDIDWAFSPAVADGTGELARACTQFGTETAVCTAAW
jgi:hypothetical protein